MISEFLDIVKDAQGSGGRVLKAWISDPGRFLRGELPVDEMLISLTEEEKEKFLPLLEFFTGLSFAFLFKRLEEGETNYSFELLMKDIDTGREFALINDEVDNNIRGLI